MDVFRGYNLVPDQLVIHFNQSYIKIASLKMLHLMLNKKIVFFVLGCSIYPSSTNPTSLMPFFTTSMNLLFALPPGLYISTESPPKCFNWVHLIYTQILSCWPSFFPFLRQTSTSLDVSPPALTTDHNAVMQPQEGTFQWFYVQVKAEDFVSMQWLVEHLT